MATEFLYDFFRNLYEEESERYGQLEVRARLYITILVFYLGAVGLNAKDMLALTGQSYAARVLVSASGIAFILALSSCLIAIKMRKYEGLSDPNELIDSFGGTLPSDDDFREDRIVDFAVATERNAAQNDRVARALSWAIIFIFGGVALHVTAFLTTLYS
jgi:hypothetical protein